MFRNKIVLVGLVLAIVLLGSCGGSAGLNPDDQAQSAIDLVDGLRRSVHLNGSAQKIVSLSPSVTESLFALGAGGQVVGREDSVGRPEEALAVPSVGSLWGDLPVEAILAMEPDLVLAGEIISAEQVQALEDLGLTVFWQANPKEMEDLFGNLEVLGVLAGKQSEAAVLVEELRRRVSVVEDAVGGVDVKPLVFYELDATEPENPWTAGGGTFIDMVISIAGGENLGASLEGEWVQVSTEEIIARDPDVILLGDALYGISPESVAGRPGWGEITAIKEGKVFPVDPYLLSVPGPSLVTGLEEVAKILHPELFK